MSTAGHAAMLVLNLGSATLKAARFARAGTAAVKRIEIPLGDPGSGSDGLLAQVAAELGFGQPPACVAHRIVHGGDATGPRVLDHAERMRLQALQHLAPLHQPRALALVDRCAARWPGALQCGVFDTTWHAGLPDNARRLPVPGAWAEFGIRRYGFHGLAFASAMRLLEVEVPDAKRRRVVLAHLGGGASLCAVSAGRSVDTTMAMTPLEGLPMATRSGSLDPGALLFLLRSGRYTVDTLEQALYRECGLRGLSGISGDVRELVASAEPAARLALDVFALRVAQGIAAMATHLGGIDELVFSGGIGTNASAVREAIVAYLAWLHLGLDRDANAGGATCISPPGADVRVWRIEVDEEGEIARQCASIGAMD